MPLIKRRVLIVEDEPLISDLIETMINDNGGVTVGPYATVTDALEQMGDLGGIDAAILDIGLGGEDSYALASALQATSVPFVFVTGRDQSELPAKFERSAYLSKPFTADQLVAALIACGALRH